MGWSLLQVARVVAVRPEEADEGQDDEREECPVNDKKGDTSSETVIAREAWMKVPFDCEKRSVHKSNNSIDDIVVGPAM